MTPPINKSTNRYTVNDPAIRPHATAYRGAATSGAPLNVLSLGAGVQSSALLKLSAMGEIPLYDLAVFADTGWEPPAVYAHLARLESEVARPAGIPILRVSSGNIRTDALDPAHRFASMPVYVLNSDGTQGLARRQCTSEYKVKPIKRGVRAELAARRVKVAAQSIGISTDEFERAKDSDVSYLHNRFPLLELGLSRKDCVRLLDRNGLADTPKSACTGCPFRRNAGWRQMRDERPEEFADAVAFDAAIRSGGARANAAGKGLRGQAFLHRSCLPLDVAPIDKVTRAEWKAAQPDIFDALAEVEDDDPDGCSPWTCRNGAPETGSAVAA